MHSPFFYIVFSLMFSSAALSVIFFIAWRNFGRRPHALTWSLAFAAGTLEWVVNLDPAAFPTPQLFAIVENALAVTLITLSLRGHCQRTECSWLPQNLFPLGAAVYAIAMWFTLVDPHAGIRLAIIPAYAAVSLLLSGWMIFSYREQTRPSEWATTVFIVLFASTQAIAAWIAVSQGASRDQELFNAFMHFTFLTMPAGYVGMSMFIILMMASDISEKMTELAVRDQLTGLFNRRGFIEYGEKAFSAAQRENKPLSVILTDIDRFKHINDKFGHAAGDAALRHFAGLIVENRRNGDIVARVGGEEFALLLPGTELRDAMAMADQLCSKIGATPIETTSVGLPMTSSFGVAAISRKDDSLDDIMRRADRALYRSKRAGRNQVDLESSQLMLAEDGTLQPVGSG